MEREGLNLGRSLEALLAGMTIDSGEGATGDPLPDGEVTLIVKTRFLRETNEAALRAEVERLVAQVVARQQAIQAHWKDRPGEFTGRLRLVSDVRTGELQLGITLTEQFLAAATKDQVVQELREKFNRAGELMLKKWEELQVQRSGVNE